MLGRETEELGTPSQRFAARYGHMIITSLVFLVSLNTPWASTIPDKAKQIV